MKNERSFLRGKTIGINMQEGTKDQLVVQEKHEIHPLLQKMRVQPVAPENREGFFECASGDQLFYRVWAAERPEKVIVCVHGMVAHNDYLVLVADQLLEEGVTTYAIDLKQHGYSSGRKGDLESFGELVDQLHEFVGMVKHENPELPVHVLGNSIGGAVVIHHHLLYPEDGAGLILMAPAVKTRINILARDALVFPYLALAFVGFKGKPVVNLAKRQKGGLGPQNPLRIELDAQNPLRIKKVSVRYLLKVNKWVKRAFKGAEDITCPIIIFQGIDDRIVSLKGVTQFFEFLVVSDWRLVRLEGAYHSLFSDPVMEERGYEQLRSWLRKY